MRDIYWSTWMLPTLVPHLPSTNGADDGSNPQITLQFMNLYFSMEKNSFTIVLIFFEDYLFKKKNLNLSLISFWQMVWSETPVKLWVSEVFLTVAHFHARYNPLYIWISHYPCLSLDSIMTLFSLYVTELTQHQSGSSHQWQSKAKFHLAFCDPLVFLYLLCSKIKVPPLNPVLIALQLAEKNICTFFISCNAISDGRVWETVKILSSTFMFMITVWCQIFFLSFAEAASGMPSTLSYFQSSTKSPPL